MAGNLRYELSSASPEELNFAGIYPNGQRGNYTRPTFDRSGSFRESNENRTSISGASTPRGSSSMVGDVAPPPLTQFLLLDPITMGDQKFTRSGELRRALGISLGSSAEDNSFGAAHSKPPHSVIIEELKRFKTGILDSTSKAKNRTNRLNESLLRLNRYWEALNFKKPQRSEVLMNEKSSGSNYLKLGIQSHRNPSDLSTQRLEDRAKNSVLQKRVRSSVAELRADGRSNTLPRQPLAVGKDRDMPRDGSDGSEVAEEKVRRLPAGGEGWDRKMKRKRSVGAVLSRHTDSEGEVKQVMHHKFSNEPGLHNFDSQGFRSTSYNGTTGSTRLEGASSPATPTARAIVKTEPEKAGSTRDFANGISKERVVARSNNKINNMEDNQVVNPSPMIKGKASRAPRTSSVMAVNSSYNLSRNPSVLDDKQQSAGINKTNSVGGTNSRKRPVPSESSSPMAWGGQRPQKISRTRRANVVSPISNHDDVQISSEGGPPPDFAPRVTSVGVNGSLISKDTVNGIRMKHENVSSPARLSESEESGAGENREGAPKDKEIGSVGVEERSLTQNVVPSALLPKRNKVLNKEDTGDGVRRQGRTARGALSSRASISPMRDKLENPASTKPLKNARVVSDKSGSKSGRPPLKKISDRKAFARFGQAPTSGSPDFTGESDDDREELLDAANFACNASYLACSGPFWKKIELVFGPICFDDLSYLKQQVKSAEELQESLSEMFGPGNNNLVKDIQPHIVSEENERSLADQILPKQLAGLAGTPDLVHQNQENGTFCGNSKKENKVTPLYQRVLSALIIEDESEQFGENNGGNISFQHDRDYFPDDNRLPIDYEAAKMDVIEADYVSGHGFLSPSQSFVGSFPCNGSNTVNKAADFVGHHGFMPSKIGMLSVGSENDEKTTVQTNDSGVFILNCRYEQLCPEDKLLMELQSVSLFPETVPDLADGEDEAINQEIVELQKRLDQQVSTKKTCLDNLIKAVEKSTDMKGRSLEQVAMDRLVELAYKKQLATRGSSATKLGVPKVSKQVALAFTKRTLVRCRKLEDTGKSCFSEPALRDVIPAAPPRGNDMESLNFIQDPKASGSFPSRAERLDHSNGKLAGGASDACGLLSNTCDQDFAKTGPILNRGKKKEVLLDDVGGNASLRATSSLGDAILSGAKGKRSERERDKDTVPRSSVAKGSRASQNKIKNDNKTKSKPKQKTASLSTPGNGSNNKFKQTGSNPKREVGLPSQGHGSRENTNVTDLQDLDTIDTDFAGPQDLNSLFDGIPDNDLGHIDLMSINGLDIPMDDLSFMF